MDKVPRRMSEDDHVQVGTPLTHRQYLRRFEGSYGPGIIAGKGTFPFPPTPLKGEASQDCDVSFWGTPQLSEHAIFQDL